MPFNARNLLYGVPGWSPGDMPTGTPRDIERQLQQALEGRRGPLLNPSARNPRGGRDPALAGSGGGAAAAFGNPLARAGQGIASAIKGVMGRVGEAQRGSEDILSMFAEMLGSGAGGGGYGGGGGGGMPLRDVNAIRDRFSKARSELDSRYERSIGELGGIYEAAKRDNERTAADRAASTDRHASSMGQIGTDLDSEIAAIAAEADAARAAHGIEPSAGSIRVNEAQGRDRASFDASTQNAIESLRASDESSAIYNAELQDLLNKSGLASAEENRMDADTALALAEAQAIEEAEQFNAAAAASGGGGGYGGGDGLGALGIEGLLNALIGENDAWEYPNRMRALQEQASLPPRMRELVENLFGAGSLSKAQEAIPLTARMMAEAQRAQQARKFKAQFSDPSNFFNVIRRGGILNPLGPLMKQMPQGVEAATRDSTSLLQRMVEDYYRRGSGINPSMQGDVMNDIIARVFG